MSLIIERLSFSYGEKLILREINLNLQTGESIGITGESGGGKTTLLKLVSGLYDVTDGRINVAGAESPAERRRSVAMVTQNASLFPASIRDNITCGHPMSDKKIFRACEAALLSGWIASLDDGLETFVGERGNKISGGQAQRISIARAIAKDAPVILLDEPTSALDDETSGDLLKALCELTKNKTVVHVSHRTETLATRDRIFILEGSRLLVK